MKLLAILAAAVVLSGCATGRELNGSWSLSIGRDGRCRAVVHAADTDQLRTRTVWRGEGCEPKPAADAERAVDPAPVDNSPPVACRYPCAPGVAHGAAWTGVRTARRPA